MPGPSFSGLRSRPLHLSPSCFFFPCLCPSALGFEWRWHRLVSGVVEGAPETHKTPGSASTELPGSPARPWLCVPQFPVTKAMSPFGRLATLESAFHLVFGARGTEETLAVTSHSLWDGVPTPIPRLRCGLGRGVGSLSPQCLDPPAASLYRQVARCPPPRV